MTLEDTVVEIVDTTNGHIYKANGKTSGLISCDDELNKPVETDQRIISELQVPIQALVAARLRLRTVYDDSATVPILEQAVQHFDERTQPHQIVRSVLASKSIVTIADNGDMYDYDEKAGVFRLGAGNRIAKALEHTFRRIEAEKVLKINVIREINERIKRRTYRNRDELNKDQFILNLKNGMFDLNRFVLLPHDPKYLSTVQLQVSYDPNATCPNIMKFFEEALYAEDLPVIQELLGYCLWRDYPAAKAWMLFGTGSNGKSTFITLLRTLLGMENIASRGLVDLEKNRFAMADLYLKLANLYADLEDVALRTTGKLKMLTGKDTVTAEHKFRNGFPFVNYAKMVFSANKIPEVLDDSDAFFRRWVIITFPNQFTKDSTTKEDRNLIQKLSTADELSGLLNFALEGLKRLRANNWHFSNPKTTEEIRTEYIRKSSPIEAFLMDCTDPDVESFVPRAELFSTFSEYCHQNKLPVPSTDVFFKRLPQINPRLLKYYPGLKLDGKEKRVHCIKGLKLRQRQDWGKNRENDDADAETKESENPAQTEQPAQNKTLDPSVQGVQRVQGSAYLSVTEEIIEQAANTLREKLPILRLRDSSELVTYLQNLYGRDTAERMVKQLKPRLQSNPEGYLELI